MRVWVEVLCNSLVTDESVNRPLTIIIHINADGTKIPEPALMMMTMPRWIENKHQNTSLSHLIGPCRPRVRSRSRFRLRFVPLTVSGLYHNRHTPVLPCLLSRSDFGPSWIRWSLSSDALYTVEYSVSQPQARSGTCSREINKVLFEHKVRNGQIPIPPGLVRHHP